MAKLSDLIPNKELDSQKTKKTSASAHKYIPKKRRAWINDEKDSNKSLMGSIKPINETDSINGVNKPYLSTLLNNEQTTIEASSLSLEKLRSNPLKIIWFLYDNIDPRSDNFRTTYKMTTLSIVNALNISKDSVRTALRFLIKNNVITRVDFKIGKLGYSVYALNSQIINELSTEKGSINPIYE